MRTPSEVRSTRRARRSALTVAIVALASAALAMPLGARQADDTAEAAAWVDAPRDGATVLIGAVEVVGHATDPTDVSEIALLVDGTEVQNTADVGGTLAHARFTLDLAAPGVHELVVRSSGRDGAATSDPVTITIVDGPNDPAPSSTTSTSALSTTSAPPKTTALPIVPVPTEPPLTAPPRTARPPPTAPPPTTSCTFGAPILTSPANGSTTPLTRVGLSWSYGGCRGASGYDVEVATNPAFFESVASTRTATTSWVTPPLFCDTFFWRVRAFDRVDSGPWSAVRSFGISFRGCP